MSVTRKLGSSELKWGFIFIGKKNENKFKLGEQIYLLFNEKKYSCRLNKSCRINCRDLINTLKKKRITEIQLIPEKENLFRVEKI